MKWLNYHHLHYFWLVAREGGLGPAASVLRLSRPTLSAQIRALEGSLGERLFARKGRRLVLTEVGRVAYRYADQIFALGREMMNTVKQRPGARTPRFYVGVADSFPKLVTKEILKPVFALPQIVHVICREGKLEDLLAQLAAHRLDIVLADEPGASSANFKTFDHPLGESSTVFCAERRLAAKLRRNFPKSLHEAPALLPAENTPFRRKLETWFRDRHLQPRVVAEFEDLALMKVMAAEGRGFIAVPSVAARDAVEHYGFRPIAEAADCQMRFHAITAERRIHHPAATAITTAARARLG